MAYFSGVQSNLHPSAFVRCVDYQREGQIIARLLAERFPGSSFSVEEGGAFNKPDAHGSIRDCAHSSEVEQITRNKIQVEIIDNPERKLKWHVYFFDQGEGENRHKVSAYLDHDLKVRRECETDPHLAGHCEDWRNQTAHSFPSMGEEILSL